MKPTMSDGSETGLAVTPERSLDQRLAALARANEVRTLRAQVKRDLKVGRVSLATLLVDPPAHITTARVLDMLLAVPKLGRVRTNKLLTQCRISPSKTVGGLSERQRAELVRLLTRQRDTAQPPARSADAHADRDLRSGLTRLLNDARQVGRLAGRAAGMGGVELDARGPRPDIRWVQAGLTQTLRRLPAGPPLGGRDRAASERGQPAGPPHLAHTTSARDELRLARAELKRAIGAGMITVGEVILSCPPEAMSMTIAELITSQRGWGTARCSRFLGTVAIADTKTVGSLTDRQRGLLAAML